MVKGFCPLGTLRKARSLKPSTTSSISTLPTISVTLWPIFIAVWKVPRNILLLFIPSQAPFDLWTREVQHGVKLYVRRVFIMDDAEKLMPRYLRFVRGIIDSNDLPLNVSRELLQQNKLIDAIRSNSIKKILGLLSDIMKNDQEKYASFWKEFGRVLKEGILEDHPNRESLAKLLRFATTTSGSETQNVSLEDYVARMKEGQDKIYYVVADSYAAANDSPLLEIFKKKGIEVLLLSDPVDHLVGPELRDFRVSSCSRSRRARLI